ncbi:tRNA-dependent cyclodipeptide synthase [Streptomyces sp. CG1]|uniref:tRNA-dependent cyclodipeptide synthase n=1 Tax=Streptomyces sp. CG1 TaxID=1287523 RepID=UPI0034E28A58
MDDLEIRLLHALKIDGRVSFSRLARVLGVSDQTVARRCRKLQPDVSMRVLLEQRSEPDRVLKAGSIGPLAIEALERIGLGDELVAAEQETMAGYAQMAEQTADAVPGGRPDVIARAQREHFAGLEKIEAARRSEPGRRRMRVPQPVLVEILRRKAEHIGVRLLSAHTMTGLRQDEDGVTVAVRTPDGEQEFRSRYLLGCDGGGSAVRTAAGFEFPGTGPAMLGRQGVVELVGPAQIPPGIHDVPGGVLVYGLGVDRVAALEFVPPPDEDLGRLTERELREAVERVAGIDLGVGRMRAGGRFTDEARHVPTYRKGWVLFRVRALSEVMNLEEYQNVRERTEKALRDEREFSLTCDRMVHQVMLNSTRAPGAIGAEHMRAGRHYVTAEAPLFVDSPAIFGVPSSALLYHLRTPITEYFARAPRGFRAAREQGYVAVGPPPASTGC